MIVTTQVDRPALSCVQFIDYFCFILLQLRRQYGKALLELFILALRGQRLSPVECQIEMTSPIVQFVDFSGGRLVAVEKFTGRLIQGFR